MGLKFILIGYYGFGNFGDEWLRQQSYRLLDSAFPNCQIICLTNGPNTHTQINRRSWCRLLYQIWKSNGVVFGGGGIFQNQTSRRSPYFYGLIAALAWWCRRPVIAMGQSIGPLRGRMISSGVKWGLNRSAVLALRHASSWFPNALITADLAYYNATYQAWGKRDGDIAVCVRSRWLESHHIQAVETMGASVGIICQPSQDVRHQNEVTLPDIPKTRLSVVVSMRYHACIWASLLGIPFIAWGDDPKLKNIAQQCGQHWVGLDAPVDWDTLLAHVQQEWSRYQHALTMTVPRLIDSFSPLILKLRQTLSDPIHT